ncbi:MAG: T9SS type A sorting domain-containing protein [Bacteroidetes bacterium]|nr:T9SS type A sorting domain-containing protein [Bacteroidota bacterium]
MKKSIALVLVLFSVSTFAQKLNWAYPFTSSYILETAQCIASNGEYFVLYGDVYKDVDLDVKSSSGEYIDIRSFMACYNQQGEIQWAYDKNRAMAAAVTGTGLVYSTGMFSGTIDMDPSENKADLTLASGGIFVQVLNTDGSYKWAAAAPVNGQPTNIAVKSNGNAVVIGRTDADFTTTLSDNSQVDLKKGIYLIEFSSNAKAIGAYSISTPESFSNILSLHIDADDNVFVGGSTGGSTNFGLKGTEVLDTAFEGYDAFIVKYDKDFNHQWHKIFGDVHTGHPAGWEAVTGIKTGNGKVYAAGYFTWTTDFDRNNDPGKHQKIAGDRSQTPDGFIIEYNTNDGAINWVTDAGTHESIKTNTDVQFMDLVLKDDNLIVSGTMAGGADFDGSEKEFILNTPDGGGAICIAHYKTDGSFKTAWLIDGALAGERTNGTELLGNGIVTCGTFSNKCEMDPNGDGLILQTDSTGLRPEFDNDLFIASYDLGFTSGISSIEKKAFATYPNPINRGETLFLDKGFEQGRYLKIYDMAGKLMLAGKFTNQVPIGDFNAGTYILMVENQSILIMIE